jgi:hypothetical protein
VLAGAVKRGWGEQRRFAIEPIIEPLPGIHRDCCSCNGNRIPAVPTPTVETVVVVGGVVGVVGTRAGITAFLGTGRGALVWFAGVGATRATGRAGSGAAASRGH